MQIGLPLEDTSPQFPISLPLERVFGSPAAKILDFLLLHRDFDYSESDISKGSSVPHRTLQRILPNLVDEEIVVKTRKSGKRYMYAANLDSERVNALLKYVKATMEENLDQIEVSQSTN